MKHVVSLGVEEEEGEGLDGLAGHGGAGLAGLREGGREGGGRKE